MLDGIWVFDLYYRNENSKDAVKEGGATATIESSEDEAMDIDSNGQYLA